MSIFKEILSFSVLDFGYNNAPAIQKPITRIYFIGVFILLFIFFSKYSNVIGKQINPAIRKKIAEKNNP
jgi:hypothetical protein